MKTCTVNEAVFPACLDELANMCQCVTDAARNHGMDDRNVWKLETAVDEACTNITCYGYKDRPDGTIRLRWECRNDQFAVTIEDNGTPFDQSQPSNPDLESDLCSRKPGGLGRYIMKQFLDGMHYQRKNGTRSEERRVGKSVDYGV